MSRLVASSHLHKSKTLDNKYMLGDEIGKGAYGRVYKGLDLENGDFVAIKQVSLENIGQESLNIIMQEIDLLKNLNHKNIVKYLGSLKTKSHLHIILEYVENGSLANIIKPNNFGPFPEQLVAHYIAQVLQGLVYLHEQGVIHCDIKGANILITKEGLVKLADFGVATKLTEADVNTQSVVGTPYWIAPEVIELSGVCAASDIWSVGCTVIELLTCVPPYYDLLPMTALFRIVQDEHPPIPDGLSADMTDFLRLCFKKDARQRPDANMLLSHPWIQNYRRILQPSLPSSDAIRNIGEDVLIEAELSTGDENGGVESQSVGETQGSRSGKLSEQEHKSEHEEVLANGDLASPKSKRKDALSGTGDGKEDAVHKMNNLFSFGTRNQDKNLLKVAKKEMGNELSKFSDSPGDACLEDLFRPLNKNTEDRSVDTSASTSASCANPRNAAPMSGENGLAAMLRAAIAKKQMEIEAGQTNGGNLLRIMIRALKEDVIDIDSSLVFNDNMPGENLFPLQAVEYSRLVSLLRPEEPEDVIVNACQKLIPFFNQRCEQKIVFVQQHGLLPLMELLEVPRPRVICSVLQLINTIIKDNTDFQENACHVGLIPVVMGFAVPDRSREVRMEAAYFLQQLCQSSSLTLQMFIACRGIPVLVGFLEADYAKYREMVHLAINGMWQVLKLQRSTPRNDFCRIAAKNGMLLRLINTLHSLNEATRLASISGDNGLAVDGSVQRPHSGQHDPHHPVFTSSEVTHTGLEQVDLRGRHSATEHSSSTVNADKPQSSRATVESSTSRSTDATDKHVNVVKEATRFELDLRQQRVAGSSSRTSTDRSPKLEGGSNGHPYAAFSQPEHVRPLLSLLEKEPPSRFIAGQLDLYQLSGIERHESIVPLLHASNEKKAYGDFDFQLEEFTEVSGRGRENGNETPRKSNTTAIKMPLTSVSSNDGAASTFGLASQRASGVLSGSGVLNARPESAASSGLLSHMVSTTNADVSKEYLEKVAELLLEFSQADSIVKSYMCNPSLLTRLFHMFNRVEPPTLLKLLKCINHLSTDPNCLENLQRAEAIKHLIPNLVLKEGPFISQIHHEVLNALFNLCKINKRRQEQAAENGIIPHLMNFILLESPLKQYALTLLCDIAHASRNSREQLRAHGGLDVYLNLLDDELWSVTALDSIAVCLAHDNDNRKVEQALLKRDAVQKLVKFFQNCPEQHFVHILEPFLKIITKSPRINTTLAVNGLTPLLVAKLDHQDAIARLNLLKIIKAVYEHHPRPKQLIVKNDLPQKLQNLIEERRDGQRSGGGGQVLVKQMATSLLKALHINTVL
ncbi:MAP3K epsilon protein kinase 1-like isoform X2 [Amaranthus tricolor]|uniref:MAP3K epsilon protein kinase 1-like isoform X2 n=1 Tax=Amaranthus tricolor TaxID=29722 RepID=UPI00258B0ACB|nr:MAP3K epsilon protein kinase 1-like isoform X2 [Amaranthus tricolor]